MSTGTGPRWRLDPPAHLEPVEAGQHHVEHDQVRPVGLHLRHRGRPVVGQLHREALGPQPGRDRLGDRALVLDHQDPALVLFMSGSVGTGRGECLPGL